MSHLTDDEIRAIWSILPLDQEPSIENIDAYVKQVLQNLKDDYINNICTEARPLESEAWNLSSQLSRINEQYQNIMSEYHSLSARNGKIIGHADIYYKLHFPEEIEKIINIQK